MDQTQWAPVSTYENPGNLPPDKLVILKKFWSILLALFSTKGPLATQWQTHFPPDQDEPETQHLQDILDKLTGEQFRSEFYSLLRHDYADLLPLRFLKARNYEVDRAMRMLVNALAFRKENIPRAMRSEVSQEPAFIDALKKGKSFVPCYDERGRTITCIRFANHSRGDCSLDVFERYTLYAMEHAHLLHLPFQDRTVLLVDMSGFSITALDLSAIKFIIQNFEQYYPEELSEGVIHNAPWIFNTAWAIIKPLLRAPTREKITFTSSLNDLAAKIGRPQAEKVLQAKMEYLPRPSTEEPFKDEAQNLQESSPECKEALKTWNDNLEELESITREWMRPAAADTSLDEIDALDTRRAAICWKLSKSYWTIDEFVRPKSYYDRAGVLPPSPQSKLNLSQSPPSPASSFVSRTSLREGLKTRMSNLNVTKVTSKNK